MKILKKILLFFIVVFVVYFAFLYFFIFSGVKNTSVKNADTMIILGAKVKGDPAVVSKVLKERLDVGIVYLKENLNTKVIVSGGQGSDESATEASVMKDYLLLNGIDEKRIFVEDISLRTQHQFENCKKILDLRKTIVVTSDFHMFRSIKLANVAGIEAFSLPSRTNLSTLINSLLREPLAITKGLLLGEFTIY